MKDALPIQETELRKLTKHGKFTIAMKRCELAASVFEKGRWTST